MKFTRRDFLNGVAIGTVAGSAMSPFELLAAQKSFLYPPLLTGLRGSTPRLRSSYWLTSVLIRRASMNTLIANFTHAPVLLKAPTSVAQGTAGM